MSNNASRKRQAKPVRISPLIAGYVQSLSPAGSIATPTGRVSASSLLMSRTWQGVTVNRFSDSCELIFAGGRKVQAASPLKLLWCLLRGVR